MIRQKSRSRNRVVGSSSRDLDKSGLVPMLSTAKVDTFISSTCTMKQPSLQIEDLESDSSPTSPV